MDMLLEIGDPAGAAQWMRDALAAKKKVMGFGHRVYKIGDSRVPTMKQAFLRMAKLKHGEKWLDIDEMLEKMMVEEKNIYPNLDFPTGPAYYLMGFDIDMFTPFFVMSRITGWTAHVMEQLAANASDPPALRLQRYRAARRGAARVALIACYSGFSVASISLSACCALSASG